MEGNLLELLGFDAREKLLIIHADDVGMCHSVNEASFERLLDGGVSSASIMVPCPWLLEAIDFFRCETGLDVGVHSTLTSEWRYYKWRPLTGAKGLSTKNGFMWPTVKDVAFRATAEEVEAEIEAQVKLLLENGVNISHLDTHMGTVYSRPNYLERYVNLALKYKILPMVPNPRPEIEEYARRQGLPIDELKKVMSRAPILLDKFLPGLPPGTVEDKKRVLMAFLKSLEPGSINQVIVHLGLDTYELKWIIGEGYKERYYEYLLVNEKSVKKVIDEQGIRLIGWKDLLKILEKG